MQEQNKSTDFTVASTWLGAMAEGSGELGGNSLRVVHSVPVILGGKGAGTNPEELLAAAAASCAVITLAAILGADKAKLIPMQCVTTARFIESQTGPKPLTISHKISLPLNGTNIDPDRIGRMVERGCMISKALAGNVDIDVCLVDSMVVEPAR